MKLTRAFIAAGAILLSTSAFAANGKTYGDVGIAFNSGTAVNLDLGMRYKDKYRLELQVQPTFGNDSVQLGLAAFYDYTLNSRWKVFAGVGVVTYFHYGPADFNAKFQFDLGGEFAVNNKFSIVGTASVPYGLMIAGRLYF